MTCYRRMFAQLDELCKPKNTRSFIGQERYFFAKRSERGEQQTTIQAYRLILQKV